MYTHKRQTIIFCIAMLLLITCKKSSISDPPGLNKPPVALAGSNQSIYLPVDTVLLDGSGSTDDARIATYLWTKISGPSPTTIENRASAKTIVRGLMEGIYAFR